MRITQRDSKHAGWMGGRPSCLWGCNSYSPISVVYSLAVSDGEELQAGVTPARHDPPAPDHEAPSPVPVKSHGGALIQFSVSLQKIHALLEPHQLPPAEAQKENTVMHGRLPVFPPSPHSHRSPFRAPCPPPGQTNRHCYRSLHPQQEWPAETFSSQPGFIINELTTKVRSQGRHWLNSLLFGGENK